MDSQSDEIFPHIFIPVAAFQNVLSVPLPLIAKLVAQSNQ